MADETDTEPETDAESGTETKSEDLDYESMDASEEEVDKIMEQVEENPPENLEDWPGGKAKYRTIGGSGDADEDWEDGPTAKLGPAEVVHHTDGSVSVGGEKVDNPDDYKGEPIPGGPTDPDAPEDPAGLADDSGDDGKTSSDNRETDEADIEDDN